MKIVITLITLLSISAVALFYSQYQKLNAVPVELESKTTSQEYENWKNKYGKNRLSATLEGDNKYKIFQENLEYIKEFNREHKDTKLSLNQFADETLEEFQLKHLGEKEATKDEEVELEKHQEKEDIQQTNNNGTHTNTDTQTKLTSSSSVNWKSRMPPVKDQGRCGSCWAFSAIGAIEGYFNTHYNQGTPKSFSEQEVLDCNKENRGCNGGRIEYGLSQHNYKSDTEYPYKSGEAGEAQSCKRWVYAPSFGTTGYTVIKNDPYKMLAQLQYQPLAIEIKQGQRQLQFYSSGIIQAGCENNQTDHAVVIVGYELNDNNPYWVIRNSYGPDWGENGHMRISVQTGRGLCGINRNVLYPTQN